MSIHSRLQGTFQAPTENPNLVPRAPHTDRFTSGRFNNVNVPNSAQLRTQLPVTNPVTTAVETVTPVVTAAAVPTGKVVESKK